MNDTDEAELLAKQYKYWGEHPDYASVRWRDEVANEETRLGYWQWVAVQMSMDVEENH